MAGRYNPPISASKQFPNYDQAALFLFDRNPAMPAEFGPEELMVEQTKRRPDSTRKNILFIFKSAADADAAYKSFQQKMPDAKVTPHDRNLEEVEFIAFFAADRSSTGISIMSVMMK